MDDFYTACREEIQSAPDSTAAINELAAISLHDLPQMQICKFVEQTVTLLSVIYQEAIYSPQDLTTPYNQIRQQLECTLDYMEQVMKWAREFPPSQQPGGCWW